MDWRIINGDKCYPIMGGKAKATAHADRLTGYAYLVDKINKTIVILDSTERRKRIVETALDLTK